jgi:hypothetical protein
VASAAHAYLCERLTILATFASGLGNTGPWLIFAVSGKRKKEIRLVVKARRRKQQMHNIHVSYI